MSNFKKDDEDFGDPSGERWDKDGLGAIRGILAVLLITTPLFIVMIIALMLLIRHWK